MEANRRRANSKGEAKVESECEVENKKQWNAKGYIDIACTVQYHQSMRLFILNPFCYQRISHMLQPHEENWNTSHSPNPPLAILHEVSMCLENDLSLTHLPIL